MSSDYILAVDEGTTGITAMILDARGQIVSRAYHEIASHFPNPGWVEQSPVEIFHTFKKAAREAIASAKIEPLDVCAMGLTNQRETIVLWNKKTLEPASPAIVWQCKRSMNICERLKEDGLEATVRRKTGLRIDPYFSATKIRWVLDHHEKARAWFDQDLLAVGTIDTWLIANLTQGKTFVTDATNASRTLVFDIHRKVWDEELLAHLGFPETILPAVQDSCSLFAECDPVHLGAPIPILGVAGDQQASLFGHGCTQVGSAKCTFGTGAFAMVQCGNVAQDPRDGLLLTLACDQAGAPTYALEGSIFMAGAIIQWIRDQLGLVREAKETEALARSVESSGGVFLVPAFSGLGTPHWNPSARAAIVGMTRGTNRAHIARAALEAIAFQTAELIDAFETSMDAPLPALRIDGGVSLNGFFVEQLANLLGKSVVSSRMIERTALGAGRLASLHPMIRDRFAFVAPEDHVSNPNLDEKERKRSMAAWKRAIDCVIHYAASEPPPMRH